jgi:Flp pilus assembly pilin Flp
MLAQFLKHEDGAVTVDWVVLAAAVVGLGVASVAAVQTGTSALGSDIDASLSSASVVAIGRLNGAGRQMGFETGIDGITAVFGDTSAFTWSSMEGSDGEPGVLMFNDNTANTSWVNLGQSFTGDQSTQYGGTLSYDVNIVYTQTGQYVSPTYRVVELVGANGTTLTYSGTENPPVGQWTSVSAPITEGSLRLSNGQPASEAQIRAVLANVQATNIRTEYFSNGETIAFDNIRFD